MLESSQWKDGEVFEHISITLTALYKQNKRENDNVRLLLAGLEIKIFFLNCFRKKMLDTGSLLELIFRFIIT